MAYRAAYNYGHTMRIVNIRRHLARGRAALLQPDTQA